MTFGARAPNDGSAAGKIQTNDFATHRSCAPRACLGRSPPSKRTPRPRVQRPGAARSRGLRGVLRLRGRHRLSRRLVHGGGGIARRRTAQARPIRGHHGTGRRIVRSAGCGGGRSLQGLRTGGPALLPCAPTPAARCVPRQARHWGILAVYGTEARTLSAEQRRSLMLVAEQAVAGIELRSRLSEFVLLAAAPGAPAARSAHGRRRSPAGQRSGRHLSHGCGRQHELQQPRVPPHIRAQTRSKHGYLGAASAPRRQGTHGTGMGGVLPAAHPQPLCLPHADGRRGSPSLLRAGGPRRRRPRLGGDDHRLYRSGDRARRLAPGGNAVPQYLRPGAPRHRLRRSGRKFPALQPGLLRHAGLRCRRRRQPDRRRSDFRGGCRPRDQGTRPSVERRNSIRGSRETLPAQGRPGHLGAHHHVPGSRERRHTPNTRSNSCAISPPERKPRRSSSACTSSS